jgi:hypothetical protein
MNRNSPTPERVDLDQVLTQYFQAQLPTNWPDPIRKAEVRTVRDRASTGWRTRFTLAASVAALCGLGFLLSDSPSESKSTKPNDSLMNRSTADGSKLHRQLEPKDRNP